MSAAVAIPISAQPLHDSPLIPAVTAPFKPALERKNSPPYSPLCWGHRGKQQSPDAVASIPSSDPLLDRTTNGTGRIQTQKYHGVLDKLVTNKSPHQRIPTFRETIALLMKPNNMHVFLNIDVKVFNEPVRLFTLMNEIISSYEDYETLLAPRLVLGLWHPKYLQPARDIIPYLRLAHIGMSTALARKHFWDSCGSFSMNFSCLVGGDGEAFRSECKAAGKDVYVWTVNKRSEMIEATKWGAKAILTDRTAEFLALREQMENDWSTVSSETTWRFAWTSIWYTSLANYFVSEWERYLLTSVGGPMIKPSRP
ncbi:phosphatidylglycerol phospholipase C, partial [Phenoliferia sp. Uapishka_3]